MEDLDILWNDDDVEGNFIDLVKNKWPKDMFVQSAEAMLGKTWMEDGELILKEQAPELLDYFAKNYADKSSTRKD